MSATAAGDRSVAIAGDVVDSIIVTGDHADVRVVVGAEDGARLERMGLFARRRERRRVPPLGDPPPPFPGHVDRDEALAAIHEVRGALNLHGERGLGKTWALAEALGHGEGGVVWLDAKGLAVDDVLQDLFRAFWDCEPPCVPVGTRLRAALAHVRALVVVDGIAAAEDDAQRLVASAPECRFVLASRERVLWSAEAHALAGLAPPDALRVVEQELGRELRDDERARAERLCAEAGGNPLRIRQGVAGWEAGNERADDERRLIAALALFGETAVGVERLAEITGVADAGAVLERLRARHVVAAHSPRYSLLVDAAPAGDPQTLRRALASLARVPEPEPALALLGHARGMDADVVALSRAVSPAVAASGHWAAWDRLLETALHAARCAGDADGEGWALHQLGTLAFCLGRTAAAVDLLERALAKRDAKVTHHNLRLVRGGGGGLPSKAAMGGLLAVVAVGGAAVAVAVGGGDDPTPPTIETPVAMTTETERTAPRRTDTRTATTSGITDTPTIMDTDTDTDTDTGTVTVPEPPVVLRVACPPEVRGGGVEDLPYIALVTGRLQPAREAPVAVTLTDQLGRSFTGEATSDPVSGEWTSDIPFGGGVMTAIARITDEKGVEARPCEFEWPP